MELATGGTLANQIEQATKTFGRDQKTSELDRLSTGFCVNLWFASEVG